MQQDIPDLSHLKSGTPPPHKGANTPRSLVIIVYALQSASLFFGFTVFIALIINYVKRADMAGTLAESHFRWQINTFWFYLLWLVIGYFTIFLLIGYLIIAVASLWFIYRIVRGWLRIFEHRPMYSEAS